MGVCLTVHDSVRLRMHYLRGGLCVFISVASWFCCAM